MLIKDFTKTNEVLKGKTSKKYHFRVFVAYENDFISSYIHYLSSHLIGLEDLFISQ